jgi:hypothetical protein
MKPDMHPIELGRVATAPIAERPSKVGQAEMATPWTAGGSLAGFLDRLPNLLAAADLKAVVAALVEARRRGAPAILGMGGHVIKVGLGPVVVDLMERGVVTGVAMNGAGIVHETELAMSGQTSEEVGPALDAGTFGMSAETHGFLQRALAEAPEGTGLGRAVGSALLAAGLPFAGRSILAAAARLGLPATVHVAIGTDILHMHPGFDPGRTGAMSHLDFRILAAQVARLEGGVYVNAGSAVILPEVFLKAVGLARNLGHRLDGFTTVNLDFNRHYRPTVNVLQRPTARGGRGIGLVGHHEILLPLIAAGVIEALSGDAA